MPKVTFASDICRMLPFLLVCLAVAAHGQQSQVESEDENANTQSSLRPSGLTAFRSYQPAAQQRRPVYTAPETYGYSPYSFNYVAQGEDGSSSRQETGDASGRVVGSYTIAIEDGRRRVVDYVADQDGFRATIDTNEPGTDVQNPADVVFHSAGLGRANQPTRPSTSYRPTPSRIYSQPDVVRPVYRTVPAPYDGHAYERYTHRHNDHRYYRYYE